MPRELIHGRYLFRRVIYSATSEVLHVTDRETGRDSALKSIPSRDQTLTEQLRNEFLILSGLRHPNIINAHDFAVSPELGPYSVMQYFEGSTLESRAAKLSEQQARDILLQLAAAIDFMSSRGILHRDIAPSNILIAEPSSHSRQVRLFSSTSEWPLPTLLHSLLSGPCPS